MIEKVHIRGYQSLHDVELDLEGFTLIVGESDSGKSALIRALKGWATNQSGTDFTTVGKKSTHVQIHLDDGSDVIWSKPANEFLVGENGTYKTYSKAGRTVPDEVLEHTGLTEVVFDEDFSELVNFGSQFDPPFLLTESGTRLAKALGKLSGIEFIYNAQRLAAKEIGVTKADLAQAGHMIDLAEEGLEALAGLDEELAQHEKMRQVAEVCAGYIAEATSWSIANATYEGAVSSIQVLEQEISQLPDDLPDLKKFLAPIEEIRNLQDLKLAAESFERDLDLAER